MHLFKEEDEAFMKSRIYRNALFLVVLLAAVVGPLASQSRKKGDTSAGGMDISARGSIGKKETVPTGPMFTGNGGSTIRLAILAPEVQGNVPAYLPLYVQGLLNNNIRKFSAINLIDRQNLNRIIAEQNIASNGRFSDKDFVSIGRLTNAQYFLFGTIQRLPSNRYSLQLTVTEASTGVRKASFMKDGTPAQLEENGTLLNEATADLLEQLGVQLTAAGKQALLAGNTSTVRAEAGLAQGITAQNAGAEVRALFNFAQAVTFDPSQLEALSRLTTLSTSISGGTISQRIVNDIQARDRWLEVFKETAKFYNEYPPFEITFDPSLVQIGETDFVKRTANLGMKVALDPSAAGFKALNTLVEGLEKTGRRSAWGFSAWPLADISPKTAGTVLFNGARSFTCKVDVSLLDENNKTLGRGSVTLTAGSIQLDPSGKTVTVPQPVTGIVNFPAIKAADLTPSLIIVITAVNGIPARSLNASGYMKIASGDVAAEVFTDNPRGHSNSVNSVAFSPDGRQILSGSYDRTIKLWDAATGREIRTFTGHSAAVWSVGFSPEGTRIVSGSGDYTIKLWDAATGREIRTFTGHSGSVYSARFSPEGTRIVSGSYDRTIKLWEVSTGREIRTLSGHSGSVLSVAFSPDGTRIVSGSGDYTIKLWDTATGREIRTFSGHSGSVISVAFSPDGTRIVSGSWDKTIKLWDTATGREIRTFRGHSFSDFANSVAFSLDGNQIVSSSDDKTIKLWDAATIREIRTFRGHSNRVYSAAFSPDGARIVSGSQDTTVRLWNAATGKLLYTIGTPRR